MNHNEFAKKYRSNRGVALVTALLLLSLADSGVNIVRQALINDVATNAVPTGYLPGTGAPSLALPANAFPSDITSAFGSSQSVLGSSSSASNSSWPGTFVLDTTKSSLGMTSASTNSPLCAPGSTTAITIAITCTYNYNYHIVVEGQSRAGEVNTVEEYGTVPLSIVMAPAAATAGAFSRWSTLFDKYALCSAPLVPGTFSGTMFSNDSWNWGSFSTGYILNGPVGAANANVGYMYNDGACDPSASTSDTHQGTTINPNFRGGLSVNQAPVPLPTDTYSQEEAILDGRGGACPAGGCTNSQPTNAALAVMKTAGGTAWSSSASSGVFLPYSPASGSNPSALSLSSATNAFGGLYVQGNVDQMVLTASTSGSGSSAHKLQVISIKQGSTTTTITLDLTGGTTEIADNHGNDSGAMTGLPQNVNTSPASEACMVYVTGNISSNPSSTAPTGLSGPSSGAAIQDGSGVTITAGGTISVTGNITYSTEPVSLSVSDTPVSPAPTNVLGIYTTGGNVQFQPPGNVTTMEVDASFATINGASGSTYGLEASWNGINTLNIVGGRVQNQARSGSALGQRNIYFDQRFANGFAPPWFPTTTLPAPTTDTATVQPVIAKRLSWVNSSAQ
jgi:hypothetical protein